MWIKAPASYSSTGDPIILLFSVGFPVYMSESLLQEVGSGMWPSHPPSWEGLQPRVVLWRRSWRMYLKIVTRSCKMILPSAEAEVSLDSIRYMTEACPGLEQKVYRNVLKQIFPESYHLCSRVWAVELAGICITTLWRPAPERGPFLTEALMLHYVWNPLYETSTEICFSPSTAQAVSEYSAHSWASLYSLSSYVFQAHTSSSCECWGLVLTSENLPRTSFCHFMFLSTCCIIVFQSPKFMWLGL